ncbi:hypothetical protein CORC01_00053 [Colletotrichum orchidophilum]|uniref:Uncharacterized protein n=1 Tax=Colletotrichum orchidophilum TaxID=1209926 RepID=A0A1G4BT28_9PEZI|nr:uncharacterized protein CORC01_00053 [Colletotrichum orchidophilum]OHF04582.1 hypothetical protein CORC01_00053 [Colletotrichum orchidophilum]
MNTEILDPATPQRLSSFPLEETVDSAARTPTRLGLLQTPPRRFSQQLKRPIDAVEGVDDGAEFGRRGRESPRLLATPPRRPPRRKRFSTGTTQPISFDAESATSSPDSVVPTHVKPKTSVFNTRLEEKLDEEDIDRDYDEPKDKDRLNSSASGIEESTEREIKS